LVEASTLFKAGQISYAGYYVFLKTLAAQNDVAFSSYPEMNLYVQYVLKCESIDHAKLFSELKELESKAQDRISSTPQHMVALDTTPEIRQDKVC
jgi:hypothetical protein